MPTWNLAPQLVHDTPKQKFWKIYCRILQRNIAREHDNSWYRCIAVWILSTFKLYYLAYNKTTYSPFGGSTFALKSSVYPRTPWRYGNRFWMCMHVNNLVFRNMNIVVYTFYRFMIFRFMHITSYFYCIQVVISCDSYFCVISATLSETIKDDLILFKFTWPTDKHWMHFPQCCIYELHTRITTVLQLERINYLRRQTTPQQMIIKQIESPAKTTATIAAAAWNEHIHDFRLTLYV